MHQLPSTATHLQKAIAVVKRAKSPLAAYTALPGFIYNEEAKKLVANKIRESGGQQCTVLMNTDWSVGAGVKMFSASPQSCTLERHNSAHDKMLTKLRLRLKEDRIRMMLFSYINLRYLVFALLTAVCYTV